MQAAGAPRRVLASRNRLGRGIRPVDLRPVAGLRRRLGSPLHQAVRHIVAAAAADAVLLLRMAAVALHKDVVGPAARIAPLALARTVVGEVGILAGEAAVGRRMARGNRLVGLHAAVGIPMKREEEGIGLADPAVAGMAAAAADADCSHRVVGHRA